MVSYESISLCNYIINLPTTSPENCLSAQAGPVHGPGKKLTKSSTNLVRDRFAWGVSSSHCSIICKKLLACLRATAHSACTPGGSAFMRTNFSAKTFLTVCFRSIKNLPRQVLLATQNEPGNMPRCLVALSMTFPFLCWAHKLGNTKTCGGTTACKCFSNRMFAACWSHETNTAENLASDPRKPGLRPPSSWHNAPHMHEAVLRGKALGGLAMSTSISCPWAWMLSWLWLARTDQLAAPTSLSVTSSSVSSNIMFKIWYSIPVSPSRLLSDWIWFFWQSRMHWATNMRLLITWPALAPSTSLADCLTVAVASPKAALNTASGVHCFQAPCPFGLGLSSSPGCRGSMWSMVLWRPDALEAIACRLKDWDLCSLVFFFRKFCLFLLAFIRLALALKRPGAGPPHPKRPPPPRPRRPRPPRPRRPRLPGPRPTWAWTFCCGWLPSAIPTRSGKFSIAGKSTPPWTLTINYCPMACGKLNLKLQPCRIMPTPDDLWHF